jgi:hypothetical protein
MTDSCWENGIGIDSSKIEKKGQRRKKKVAGVQKWNGPGRGGGWGRKLVQVLWSIAG